MFGKTIIPTRRDRMHLPSKVTAIGEQSLQSNNFLVSAHRKRRSVRQMSISGNYKNTLNEFLFGLRNFSESHVFFFKANSTEMLI